MTKEQKLRELDRLEISDFSLRNGVQKLAVVSFLEDLKFFGTADVAVANLNIKARRNNWNKTTIKIIKAGIDKAIIKPSPKLRKKKNGAR